MKFRTLRERNEWEGEIWKFYIQVEGNEDALISLAKLAEKWYGFELSDPALDLDESEVDILVKNTGSGYMDFHNKLTGKLTVPDRKSFVPDGKKYKLTEM